MAEQEDTFDHTEEFLEDEVFEKEEELLKKGIRPLPGADMINFLYWLKSAHPEIRRIRDISEREWRQISQEKGIPPKILLTSILALRDRSYHDSGYDEVRIEQAKLQL